MKIKATITETIVIQKVVEFDVPEEFREMVEGLDEDELDDCYEMTDLAGTEAYKERLEETGGWEFVEDQGITVTLEKIG